MLRLPKFQMAHPASVAEAVEFLAAHPGRALPVAGGTDLVPNMKHRLFEPEWVVSLAGIEELKRFEAPASGGLVLGAMLPLERIAAEPAVRERAPALAQAAGLIAGPQLRRMGTLGGNVLLDTRCQWYNQTYFWRSALGFCLKKDGTLCHVVEGGSKCVAAASNDSAPTLMTLGAVLVFQGPGGRREVRVDDFWHADGAAHRRMAPDELLVEVRIPPQATGHRGAYGKLRERGSIDFPLLGVAVRLDLDGGGAVADADLVMVALQARPVRVRKAAELLLGTRPGSEDFEAAVERVAEQAYKQGHPMPNVPGDAPWRREMIPVYVRRTLGAAARGDGPVHHV